MALPTWASIRIIDSADAESTNNGSIPQPTTSVVTREAGGISDLWGEAYLRSDVTGVNFGGVAYCFWSGVGNDARVNIDSFQYKVHYTNPTTANTDWQFPGTVNEQGGPDTAWTNPDNVKAVDANDATCVLATSGITKRLIAQNFDFSSITGGSTVVGLEVRVGGYQENASGILDWTNVNIRKADNTNGTTNKSSELVQPSSTLTTDEAGGEFDLWAETPSIADVQDVDFGFSIVLTETGANATTMIIDSMQMRIHYVEPFQTKDINFSASGRGIASGNYRGVA